ncbi:MAG: methyltransferase domain-containing protein [Opitutae bacterium]|nr:methyltransferase domain-containing protein [Opitutae bacterium]
MDLSESVGGNFNRRAATYNEHADVQRRAAKWLAEWIETGLPQSARMWELGSGTGFFTRELLRRGYRVLATDIAPEMVARGRIECPDADWAIHDSWRLPENVCDRIFSSSLLQWMPDPAKILPIFHAALRAGGKMLHGFFVAPTLHELYSLADLRSFPLRWRSEEEWVAAFRAAGFDVLRAESSQCRITYSGAAEFLRNLKNTGATGGTGNVSVGELRKILVEYDKKFGDNNGGVFATWRCFRIEVARKD